MHQIESEDRDTQCGRDMEGVRVFLLFQGKWRGKGVLILGTVIKCMYERGEEGRKRAFNAF